MNSNKLISLAASLLILGGCAANTAAPESAAAGAVPSSETATVAEAMTLGDHYLRTGDLDKALYYYAQAIQQEADGPDLYYRIGVTYDRKGDSRRADRAFRQVLLRDENHAGALEARGMICLKDRDYEKAAELLALAVQANPRLVKAYNGLGVIADLDRDHARAETLYRTALQYAPESVQTLVNLGYSRYLAGAWDEAQRILEDALQIDPENVLARQNIGLLHARAGRYTAAVEQLTHVMSVADAYNDVGYACMLENKHAVAAEFFREAIRLSPSYNKTAQDNLALNRKLASQKTAPDSASSLSAIAQTDTPPVESAPLSDSVPDTTPAPLTIQTVDSAEEIPTEVPLTEVAQAVAETPPATPQGGDSLPLNLRRWVAVPVLRVRGQASPDSEVLDRINEGRVVRIVEQDKNWAFVKYWLYDAGVVQEKTGWVNTEFLSNSRFQES